MKVPILIAGTGKGPRSDWLLEQIRQAPDRLRALDAIEDPQEWEHAVVYGLPKGRA